METDIKTNSNHNVEEEIAFVNIRISNSAADVEGSNDRGMHNNGEIDDTMAQSLTEEATEDNKKCRMGFTEIFGMIKCCFGAIFSIVDVGTDIALILEYYNAYMFYLQLLNETKIPDGVKDKKTYLFYNKYKILGENVPLREYTINYMILTIIWVVLGGIFQTCILIFRRCRKTNDSSSSPQKRHPFNKELSSLPTTSRHASNELSSVPTTYCHSSNEILLLPPAIRVLLYLTSPILMSPAVLQIYMAYQYFKGKDITNSNNLKANLKIGEITLESIPQLATNTFSICMKRFYFPANATISRVQIVSIVTSILLLCYSAIDWIATSRRKQFIYYNVDTKPHSWASLAGVFLWFSIVFITGLSSAVYYPLFNGNLYMCIPWVCNIGNFFFMVIIMTVGWSNIYWRVLRSIVHSLAVIVSICFCFYWMRNKPTSGIYWYQRLFKMKLQPFFILNVTCLFVQLILGLLILPKTPSRKIAIIFNPVIKGLFWMFRKIASALLVCGEKLEKVVDDLEKDDGGNETNDEDNGKNGYANEKSDKINENDDGDNEENNHANENEEDDNENNHEDNEKGDDANRKVDDDNEKDNRDKEKGNNANGKVDDGNEDGGDKKEDDNTKQS